MQGFPVFPAQLLPLFSQLSSSPPSLSLSYLGFNNSCASATLTDAYRLELELKKVSYAETGKGVFSVGPGRRRLGAVFVLGSVPLLSSSADSAVRFDEVSLGAVAVLGCRVLRAFK